jgi:hypothetical protein
MTEIEEAVAGMTKVKSFAGMTEIGNASPSPVHLAWARVRKAGVRAPLTSVIPAKVCHLGGSSTKLRHSGESRNLFDVNGIPAFAGMTKIKNERLSNIRHPGTGSPNFRHPGERRYRVHTSP